MQTGIFITPWIDLSDREILECIKAGAHSARIHTGKLTAERINSLIDFYHRENFKFYLDLRGNKASINKIDENLPVQNLENGQKILVYSCPGRKPWQFPDIKSQYAHYLGLNFIPPAVSRPVKGNLAFDDGKVLVKINRLITRGRGNDICLECTVTKAGKVFPGDGVSSTDIFIHSGSTEPFTAQDIEILKKIPRDRKNKIKYFAVSFVETAEHINRAINVLTELGFSNFQVVPKVETVSGIKQLQEICAALKKYYGADAELQIGRGDLSLDCGRVKPQIAYNKLVIKAIRICRKLQVKISILALVMQSVRLRCKDNPENKNLRPDKRELNNILQLQKLGVYQIGLTNDMYINRPERMVAELQKILQTNSL